MEEFGRMISYEILCLHHLAILCLSNEILALISYTEEIYNSSLCFATTWLAEILSATSRENYACHLFRIVSFAWRNSVLEIKSTRGPYYSNDISYVSWLQLSSFRQTLALLLYTTGRIDPIGETEAHRCSGRMGSQVEECRCCLCDNRRRIYFYELLLINRRHCSIRARRWAPGVDDRKEIEIHKNYTREKSRSEIVGFWSFKERSSYKGTVPYHISLYTIVHVYWFEDDYTAQTILY